MAEEVQVEEESVQPEKGKAQIERERQDQEKAEDNRRRQARQGITPVEPQKEEAPPSENPE